ncbi:MAG TPA: tetratricopeptide repeat protein, partial [Candidatus Dormibacteraeota bacterium]|nr:tetratricopeptide repeat protein [Candidatus Dormibacteraeota bacterium]
QAGLFLANHYEAEAEAAFRIANEICPTSPEGVFRFINLLLEQGRVPEAAQVAQNALNAEPDNRQFASLLEQLRRMKPK